MTHHEEAPAAKALTDDDVAGLVREALDYFAQTPSALANHVEVRRVLGGADGRTDRRRGGKRERRARSRVSDDLELRTGVVLGMFAHRGMPTYRSLRDVGRELDLHPQAVSVLLQAAFAEGLFSVQVHLPQELTEVIRLETLLQERFGIRFLLVPATRTMLDDLQPDQRRAIHAEVTRAMVRRVADHLDSLVTAAAVRSDETPFLVGVAWGRTLHLVAEYLLSTKRPVQLSTMEVVPIIGITSTLNTLPVEANVVAMDVARAYGAVSGQLPCPAFHPAVEMAVATQARQVRSMLAKLRLIRVVITGMGPILDEPDEGDIRLSNDAEMNDRLYRAARFSGAIGEICYWAWDRSGQKVQTPYRSVGLGFEGLQEIARDPARQVILVCGGDKRRFAPLRAAIEARLASVVVSDVWTARYLAGESL
jgi:DNA-binding transcriptional regulator LsrR (DeoR family)